MQFKLLILIECPNIFHWKSEIEKKQKQSGYGLRDRVLAELGPML